MGSDSQDNTFQSDGGTQNVAQGEKGIGTQNNYYGPQALPPDKPPKSSVRMIIIACVIVGVALLAATYYLAQSDNQSEAVTQANPTANTEPSTVVVDVWHRGDYATITDALKAVKPGARILVRPGVYEEGIVLDKPVEMIGDGNRDEIVIEAFGKNVVLFKATIGRLANLTLRQTGGEDWESDNEDYYAGVNIAHGRLEVEDCDISSQSYACVAIHGSANPTLRRNRIHDAGGSGVLVYGNGEGTLEDNEIFANASVGVEIRTGRKPTLRRNRIYNNRIFGVFVDYNGQGILEDNEIFTSANNGVTIIDNGNLTLRRNRISKNGGKGISVSDKGGGSFEDNDLRGNAKGAWYIDEDRKALVQRKGNIE